MRLRIDFPFALAGCAVCVARERAVGRKRRSNLSKQLRIWQQEKDDVAARLGGSIFFHYRPESVAPSINLASLCVRNWPVLVRQLFLVFLRVDSI